MIVAFTMSTENEKPINPVDRELIRFFKKTANVPKYVNLVYDLLKYIRFGDKKGIPDTFLNMSQEKLLTSDILSNYCVSVNIVDICVGDYVRIGKETYGVVIAIDRERVYVIDQFAQRPTDYLHAIELELAFKNFTLMRASKIHDFIDGGVEI